MRSVVTRLEVAAIRVCGRCGRGVAELRSGDGATLGIRLDPVRARELGRPALPNDVRSLTDLVLERLRAGDRAPGEVVLDVADGRLRALLSLVGEGDAGDVVACTAEEGVALAVRGPLALYATAEAMALAVAGAGRPEPHGGGSGPETVH
jgi:hypothetical protein